MNKFDNLFDNKSKFMTALETSSANTNNLTLSANGATMYESTTNPLLDFNFSLTKYRDCFKKQIVNEYEPDIFDIMSDWDKVLNDSSIEDSIKMKYLFFLRDCREGLGERSIFRQCAFQTLDSELSEKFISLLKYIPEYGRWDDLLLLYGYDKTADTEIGIIVREQWHKDLHNYADKKPISLLAKWLPSINSHSANTKKRAKVWMEVLGLNEKWYRKTLSTFREYLNICEKNMSSKEYGKIDYSQVPSKAALIYKNAFKRNDTERYTEYLSKLSEGKAKVNAAVTLPYEIVRSYKREYYPLNKDILLEEAWKNIPCADIKNTLVIRDGSGSMISPWSVGGSGCSPLDFADALTLFFSEHCKGDFKDKFITFSSRPEFVDLSSCTSLSEKLNKLRRYNDCSNTDLKKTFDLILNLAIENNLSQEDLPKNLIIISDMEFDNMTTSYYNSRIYNGNDNYTLMETIRKEWADHGYTIPNLVYWDLNADRSVYPEINGNVILVSGFSQNNYKMIMQSKYDPWDSLVEVLNGERYRNVVA